MGPVKRDGCWREEVAPEREWEGAGLFDGEMGSGGSEREGVEGEKARFFRNFQRILNWNEKDESETATSNQRIGK